MAFLVNPFLFFYYEEREEGDKISKVRDEAGSFATDHLRA